MSSLSWHLMGSWNNIVRRKRSSQKVEVRIFELCHAKMCLWAYADRIFELCHAKMCLRAYADSEGSDQPFTSMQSDSTLK